MHTNARRCLRTRGVASGDEWRPRGGGSSAHACFGQARMRACVKGACVLWSGVSIPGFRVLRDCTDTCSVHGGARCTGRTTGAPCASNSLSSTRSLSPPFPALSPFCCGMRAQERATDAVQSGTHAACASRHTRCVCITTHTLLVHRLPTSAMVRRPGEVNGERHQVRSCLARFQCLHATEHHCQR